MWLCTVLGGLGILAASLGTCTPRMLIAPVAAQTTKGPPGMATLPSTLKPPFRNSGQRTPESSEKTPSFSETWSTTEPSRPTALSTCGRDGTVCDVHLKKFGENWVVIELQVVLKS